MIPSGKACFSGFRQPSSTLETLLGCICAVQVALPKKESNAVLAYLPILSFLLENMGMKLIVESFGKDGLK